MPEAGAADPFFILQAGKYGTALLQDPRLLVYLFPGRGTSPAGAFPHPMAGCIRKTPNTQNDFPGRNDRKSPKSGFEKEMKKGAGVE